MSDWGHRQVLDVILEYHAGQVDAVMGADETKDIFESRLRAQAAREIGRALIKELAGSGDEQLRIEDDLEERCRNFYRQSFYADKGR